MEIIRLAKQIGFDIVGVTSADLPAVAFQHYEGWVKEGNAGEMAYLERGLERRRSVHEIMPEAQSVICLGVNYYPGESAEESSEEPRGRVARYAHGRDYHKVVEKMLKRFVEALREQYPGHEWKSYVDTGAVLERAYAERAGLGVIAENTTLITPEFGSWVFLAEVITDMKIEPTVLEEESLCGGCGTCREVCPMGAFKGPYELDARRCISYLTVENRGAIPVELRPLIGDWLYGCDACQEICPQNQKRAKKTDHAEFTQRIGGNFQLLEDILKLRTDEDFEAQFTGSPMKRAKREGLVRNACVVAANVGAKELLHLLEIVAREDASEMVREHAEWAIQQLS